MKPLIRPADVMRDIDLQLGRQIVRYERQAASDSGGAAQATSLYILGFAAQLVSAALGKGQVCLPLAECPVAELEGDWQALGSTVAATLAECHTVFYAQDSASGYANQPLVLSGERLYLARYYFYEQGVLQEIERRLSLSAELSSSWHSDDREQKEQSLAAVLDNLFARPAAGASSQQTLSATAPDWQKGGAATACVLNFTVITGGPGTGKTTTVTRLLSALISQNPDLTIALAAPTGKAAARMTESIRAAKQQATDAADLPGADKIPDESYTLHRLLGWTPGGFRYHRTHTLPFDCVVVDEASMVDLPMMYHLFNALAAGARLILLGDKDQLASVEAGSVLADLCDAGVQHGPDAGFSQLLQSLTGYDLSQYSEPDGGVIQNAVASLHVSHRFDADSGIGHLATAVNKSDLQAAARAFHRFPEVTFDGLDEQTPYWQQAAWQQAVLRGYKDFCDAVTQMATAEAVFAAFNQFQVLVALRQGPYGVEQVNQRIESLLSQRGLLNTRGPQSGWYAGRPVMISRNDYDLGLFNGDIGIALPCADRDSDQAVLRVAFPDQEGGIRWLLPGRLPAHETAFAMTVHKSQGSEFGKLCLLLPDFWQSVITRELIYTAITRGKKEFHLFSGEACWQQGVMARVKRASGLRDALWNP